MPSTNFNTDFSFFLADNDPDYIFYKELEAEIKDEESLLVLGVKTQQSVYEKTFLIAVDSLRSNISELDGVKKVKGLTNLAYPVNSFFGFINFPYIDISDDLDVNVQLERINKQSYITQHFVNNDETVMLLWIELKNNLKLNDTKNTLINIDEIRNNFKHLDTYIWGKTYLKNALNTITKKETEKAIILALIFLLVSLLALFRKLEAVFFTLSLVVFSFVLFVGGMNYLNRPFGIMSNLFPTIILIVGISDIIHLSIKYNKDIEEGKSKKEALSCTLKEIGWAIFITSFTTAIGFFTLVLSPMKALRDFGLEAGILVVLTFVLVLLLAPILFVNKRKESTFALRNAYDNFSKQFIKKIESFQNYPKTIISLSFLVLIIALTGIGFINTNNLQFSIPNKSKLKADYLFFEKTMQGSRTFELVLASKNLKKLNNPKTLNRINEIQNYLDSLPYLHAVKSPIIYYRLIGNAYKPQSFSNNSFNLDEREINKYEKKFNTISQANYFFNKEKTIFKFSAQMPDLGRQNIAKLNKDILSHVNSTIDDVYVSARITGWDYLFDRAHEQRINNMLFGLLIAIVIVGILIGLLFKNFALMLLALILNIIPIIVGAGIMGFTNLELRSGTSIIFTIAFVIAVDDTIHLLSKFYWERNRGKTIENALSNSINECGKAILATSIVLIGAFFILMFSGFDEIFTLGFLTGVIILITLAADLILAPLLILKVFKKYL